MLIMLAVKRRGNGIRLSMIIFAVVFVSVALTFGLTTAVGYEIQKKSLTDNTLELNRITANELSRTTQTIVLSMQDTLKSAADRLSKERISSEDMQDQIDFLRTSVPYFNSVVLVDGNGSVMATSPEALKIKGTKLASEQAAQALKQQKPLISAPYKAVTGRLIVLASYPVFGKDGTYAGFIGGSIYLQETNVFQKVLGGQKSNKNGSYYYVVDSAGNLIFHPDTARVGENVASNPVVQSIMSGHDGQMPVRNSKGVHLLAGYAVVPSTGWGIVSQTPVDSVETSVVRVVSRMALVSTPLMLVLMLLVIYISRKLAAPLNRLATFAWKLRHGETGMEAMPSASNLWNYEANVLYRAVSEAFRMLGERAAEMSTKAHTDTLTGLTNRRLMDEIVERWTGQGIPFSVIMLDLDRFKAVNDTYGHQKGDEVLRFLAGIMQSEKREQDYCCRYGGEEFAILLPYATEQQAFETAERIRRRTESESSPVGKPMTLSLGVSSYPLHAKEAAALFEQADRALYAAKQNGRNQTIVYSAERFTA